MIDLHTHTFLSDGELVPAELARRCEIVGFRALCFSDHVDSAVIESTVPILVRAARDLGRLMKMKVLAGCELTHCRLEQFGPLVKRARELGADLVVAHGESPVEPVLPGTNRAAIEAGVSILAHPGLISASDAREAARRGVLLEISGRRGHSLTNGHVASLARAVGAGVIFGSDTHTCSDICDRQMATLVLAGAGLTDEEIAKAFANAERLIGLKV